MRLNKQKGKLVLLRGAGSVAAILLICCFVVRVIPFARAGERECGASFSPGLVFPGESESAGGYAASSLPEDS